MWSKTRSHIRGRVDLPFGLDVYVPFLGYSLMNSSIAQRHSWQNVSDAESSSSTLTVEERIPQRYGKDSAFSRTFSLILKERKTFTWPRADWWSISVLRQTNPAVGICVPEGVQNRRLHKHNCHRHIIEVRRRKLYGSSFLLSAFLDWKDPHQNGGWLWLHFSAGLSLTEGQLIWIWRRVIDMILTQPYFTPVRTSNRPLLEQLSRICHHRRIWESWQISQGSRTWPGSSAW